MKCQQPSYHDPLKHCGRPAFGEVSPGSVWSAACFHHFDVAKRKGWLVKR